MCRHLKLTLVIAAVLAGAGAVAAATLHAGSSPPEASAVPIAQAEHMRTISLMRPNRYRSRPVVAILGHNDGTETTDYLIPYGVLAQSDAADVLAVAPEARAVRLKPALSVKPQATLDEFDERYPQGADYVVVAAMHPRNDPRVIAWIKAQQARGAIIVGVCSGVRTLSAAGLLAGRRATRYWYDANDMESDNPTTQWVQDRRYVVDRGVVTTTGITASMPVSLALVEAIAGRSKAMEVARHFGVSEWDARHDSDAFGFNGRMLAAAARNKVAVWSHETFAIWVPAGTDEVSLAFTADAWSRTFRSGVVSVSPEPVLLRRGLVLTPDQAASDALPGPYLDPPSQLAPAQALPLALASISERYGQHTASFVATQLEYPWSERAPLTASEARTAGEPQEMSP